MSNEGSRFVPLQLKLESLAAWVSIEPRWRRFDEERTQDLFVAGQGGHSQAAFGGQSAGVGPEPFPGSHVSGIVRIDAIEGDLTESETNRYLAEAKRQMDTTKLPRFPATLVEDIRHELKRVADRRKGGTRKKSQGSTMYVPSRQTRRGVSGRAAKHDPKADAKLSNDWIAAKNNGMSQKAFAKERGTSVKKLRDAQKRHDSNQKRAATNASVKKVRPFNQSCVS